MDNKRLCMLLVSALEYKNPVDIIVDGAVYHFTQITSITGPEISLPSNLGDRVDASGLIRVLKGNEFRIGGNTKSGDRIVLNIDSDNVSGTCYYNLPEHQAV